MAVLPGILGGGLPAVQYGTIPFGARIAPVVGVVDAEGELLAAVCAGAGVFVGVEATAIMIAAIQAGLEVAWVVSDGEEVYLVDGSGDVLT